MAKPRPLFLDKLSKLVVLLNEQVNHIPFDVQAMDRRLFGHFQWVELVAFGVVVIFIFIFGIIQTPPYDYIHYMNTIRADFSYYYYAYWFIPIFWLFDHLSYPLGYILWNILNTTCIFLAGRIFGGRSLIALLSFQMLYSLWFGQITGIVVGGLALMWWGIIHRCWNIAGIGLLIACTKYQTGAIPCLALLLIVDISWKDRLRVLILPGVISLLSLVAYPFWPLQVLKTVQANPPNDWGSVSLWRLIGPAALLLWVPALLLPLSKSKRFVALAAATTLALPYFQQADLLMLFVLPVGLIPLLGNVGYLLLFLFGWKALQGLVLIPLILYLLLIIPVLIEQWQYKLRLQSSGINDLSKSRNHDASPQ